MARPLYTTVIGTGSFVWMPDWNENPFSVGITANTATSGVNGTAIIEYTLQNVNFTSGDVNGTTAANYFTVVALTGATVTAHLQVPCQAIRASVVTATATSQWTFAFVQATTPP